MKHGVSSYYFSFSLSKSFSPNLFGIYQVIYEEVIRFDILVDATEPTLDPPPLIQIEPMNQTVLPGANILLPCDAEGTSNLPTIHWTFNQMPLSGMERYETSL